MRPALVPGLLGIVGLACSSASRSSSPDDLLAHGTLDQQRTAADAEFRHELDQIETVYDQCRAELATQSVCSGKLAPTHSGFQPLSLFGDLHICDTLRRFKGFIANGRKPYFFYGLSGTTGAGITTVAGSDWVWDLWNVQLANFVYAGGGIGMLVGVEGNVYGGYGFGNKPDVIAAWSGEFRSGSLEFAPPLSNLGLSITPFWSVPDRSVWGGAVGLTLSLEPSPGLSGGLTDAYWGASDAGTEAMTHGMWGVSSSVVTAPASSDPKGIAREYVQFRSSADLALGLLWKIGPSGMPGVVPGALAVGVLKVTGRAIEDLCPDPDMDAANDAGEAPEASDAPDESNAFLYKYLASCSDEVATVSSFPEALNADGTVYWACKPDHIIYNGGGPAYCGVNYAPRCGPGGAFDKSQIGSFGKPLVCFSSQCSIIIDECQARAKTAIGADCL